MKPFNYEHAKAGAPITPGVRIYDFDFELTNGQRCIMGEFGHHVHYWMKTGALITPFMGHEGRPQVKQFALLHMEPLGKLEGRYVYMGDEIIYNGRKESATTKHNLGHDSCRWPTPPVPPRVYPVTGLSDSLLDAAAARLETRAWGASPSNRSIANVAIMHGIDNGYLIDPAELAAAFPGIALPQLVTVAIGCRKLLDELCDMLDTDRLIGADELKGLVRSLIDSVEVMSNDSKARYAAAVERVELLNDIAKHCGAPPKLDYSDLLDLIKGRELVIADHVYRLGARNQYARTTVGQTFKDWLNSKLTEV